MTENKNNTELLQEIKDTLLKINSRQESNEFTKESDSLIEKVELRTKESLYSIQNSFDRIHDKLFNLNSVMIAAYFVLGTFPNESPVIRLWTSVFPIANLFYLIFIEYRQMEIHRFASNEMNWNDKDRERFGKMITTQSLLSLLSIIITIAIFTYLTIAVFTH